VAGRKVTAPTTVEVYDVTAAANDTATADLAGQFTAGNLIGSRTFTVAELTDSLQSRDTLLVPLDTAVVRQRVVSGERLRLGVRVVGEGASAQLRLYSRESGGLGPILRYDPAPAGVDSSALFVSTAPSSKTPADIPSVRSDLTDFTIVVTGATIVEPADALAVGGLPGKRSYLRFALPDTILRTSTVIRATLILHQRPDVPLDPTDTLYVSAYLGVAGVTVTDLQRAASLIDSNRKLIDSLRVVAGDSGRREIEIAPLVRVWRTQNPSKVPRAVILRAPTEGALPAEARFWSNEAPLDSLRPRLRITYTPRIEFGLP
jgi:hypothetical protein